MTTVQKRRARRLLRSSLVWWSGMHQGGNPIFMCLRCANLSRGYAFAVDPNLYPDLVLDNPRTHPQCPKCDK